MAEPLSSDEVRIILNDVARLAALQSTQLLDTGPEPSFDRLASLAARFLGVPVSLVSLVDSDRQFFKSCIGLPEPWATRRETPLSHSFCQHVVSTGRPLVIADANLDPRVRDNLAIRDIGVVAYLGIPLVVNDQVIGSFCAIDSRPRHWTDDDVAMMTDLVGPVVTEIQLRAEHRTAESARSRLQTTLASIGDGVLTTDAAGKVEFLNPVAESLCGWTDAEAHGRPLDAVFRLTDAGDQSMLVARDGREVAVETSVAAIHDDRGTKIGDVRVFRDVTQRRQELEYRRRSEEFQRLVFESARDFAIFTTDLDGGITSWNTGAENVFGFTEAEAIGQPAAILFTPEDRAAGVPARELETAADRGRAIDDRWHLRRDGTRVYLSGMVRPIRDDADRLIGFTKVARDATALKHATDALRRSDLRTRIAVESAQLGIFEWDVDADQATWENDRCYEIFGRRPEDGPVNLAAMRAEVALDDDVPDLDRAIAELKSTGRYHHVGRFRRTDGEVRWLEITGQLASEGTPRILSGTVADITDRREAELRLRRSEEQYRSLFDSMDDGYCVIEVLFDADGRPSDYRFLETNPAFVRQGGPRDAVGRRMTELVPDHESKWYELYGKVARTGESIRLVDEARALGRWFDVNAFRIGDPAERKVAVLFKDITDRMRAEQQRQLLVEQLTEADRRKDEFLAMLAHELRNPLGAIRSGVSLLQTGQAPDVVEQTLATMDRQGRNLTHMIDDLLDVSRIATGKIVLKPRTVELNHTLARAIDLVRPLVEARRHTLTLSRPETRTRFVADPTRCEQVLVNLLTNAAKYTPTGGAIHVEARVDGDMVVCTVSDNGVGIPAEMLPKVFGLFTQIDSSIDRSQGGLGIGLTLVHTLVEMHGGRVTAVSPGPNQGSKFTVTFPIGEPIGDDLASDEPKPIRPVSRARRLLIIDDNRDTARLTARLLKHRGYDTLTAHDGHEGIEAAQAFRPDIILLDIGLPGMNGYEVAQALRDEPTCRETLIVAVSGYGESAARDRSRAAGFDHHLTKPLDFERLDDILCDVAVVNPEPN